MLSLQQALFKGTSAPQGMEYLASGCYSSVYSVAGRTDMVVKQCRSNDGSLAWLMWCERNQGRKGVPMIESLVLIADGGYLCTMRRYESMSMHSARAIKSRLEKDGYWRHKYNDGKPVTLHGPGTSKAFDTYDHPGRVPGYEYVRELEDAYMADTGLDWSDLHHNNYMWCNETQTVVITDPSSGACDPYEVRCSLNKAQCAFELTMQ